MPDGGEIITENFESSIENLNIEHWEDVHMTNTLRLLNGEDQTSFYRIEGEKVVYDIETVKKYLTHICKKEDGTLKTWKEMTDDIRAENIQAEIGGGSTTTRTTAVQIALEYLGYDVGKIDGNQGGNTEKAIKKYQREHNLNIDGQPRPEVIECLIKDINECMNGKKKFVPTIKTKLLENANRMGISEAFKMQDDGSLELTDEMKNYIIDRFLNFIREMPKSEGSIEAYLKNLKNPFNDILNGIVNENEFCVIECNLNGTKKRYCFLSNDDGGSDLLFILANLLLENDVSLMKTEMKIIPNFVLGTDGLFLSTESNVGRSIGSLWDIGITMESSKLFLDEYMKNGNITKYENIDLYSLLDDKTIKYLFGENINQYNAILPLTFKDGLVLYNLKMLWGDSDFKQGIGNMINIGVLEMRTKDDLGNLVKSKIGFKDLSEYIKLSKYLSLEKEYTLPYLEGYSPQKYFQIVKYMRENGIQYKRYSKYIKSCATLFENNVPGEALLFIDEPNNSLMKELFENKYGRELYLFLCKHPQKLQNLGGKEIKHIKLNTKKGGYNFCFRGILEMIKSMGNVKLPILGENPTREEEKIWKESWEKIIKGYENLLRNYISLDNDEKGNLKPRNKTFDKVFYANALDHKHDDWNRALQGNNMDTILKSFCKNFEDCSNIINNDGNIDETNQKGMIDKIEQYSKEHPNEKILVYIGTHGSRNGSSSNSREKEDWLKLASISDNVKIMSPRCYFGGAYTGNQDDASYIYGLSSAVSGFSNNTSTHTSFVDGLKDGYNKGLGFHELEIYTRLHYNESFTPLTDFVDYTDFNTGKKKNGKIGIADAGISRESEDDVYYG